MSEDEIKDAEVVAWARCKWTADNEGLPEMIQAAGTVEPIRRVHMAGFRAGVEAARTPATAELINRIKALLAKGATLTVKGGWDDANVNTILTPDEAAALLAELEPHP